MKHLTVVYQGFGQAVPLGTLADNGAIYNLVAFNAAGAVFGSGAVLSVQAPTAPAITASPATVALCTSTDPARPMIAIVGSTSWVAASTTSAVAVIKLEMTLASK